MQVEYARYAKNYMDNCMISTLRFELDRPKFKVANKEEGWRRGGEALCHVNYAEWCISKEPSLIRARSFFYETLL